jgi:iron-sulfur cluster assembly accessory protein
MHLIGSVVDYEESLLSSQFTFKNPNITQECGCGQSFGTNAGA